MRILKFKLSGKSAFFRNNEVNDGDITYSYGHIHKVALLGILGAILGLGGHNQAYYRDKSKYIHPEFYEVLGALKVAICPNSEFGYFQRKKYNMVNTCGYSVNKDTKHGQTLMYTEQWIENPSWDIYLDLDSIDLEIADKLTDYISNNKCVYPTYLGKTNHPAIISDVSILEGIESDNHQTIHINSMFIKTPSVEPKVSFLDDEDDVFEYREVLPTNYLDDSCFYKTDLYVFTNKKCTVTDTKIVSVEGKNLIFN